MSVWTSKVLDRDIEYIVLKHTLPGVNYVVNGIKFRGGYAVVQKDSKTYHTLKKIPIFKNAAEYPLIHLRKLVFITRPKDVLTIYGKDVYWRYLKVLEGELDKEAVIEQKLEEQAKLEAHVEAGGCTYTLADGRVCGHHSLSVSPSQYCKQHIFDDPKLSELGIEKPKMMTKQEKKEFRAKVYKVLEAHTETKEPT